ncbi:hypothetical protein VTO42DRAFT_488 [Malbranchea cinnamomea]
MHMHCSYIALPRRQKLRKLVEAQHKLNASVRLQREGRYNLKLRVRSARLETYGEDLLQQSPQPPHLTPVVKTMRAGYRIS